MNTTETPPPGSLQRMVRASGLRRFTFFMRDESIHEIEAADSTQAMNKLCDKLKTPWWWTHREILDCLT